MTLLRATDRMPKPWKNGGGVTRDVWTWPEGAGLDAFQARVSLADVASDGPFSLFPGIDRTTAILSGAGFDLAVEGVATTRLTPEAAPFSYPGDRAASSTLIAGPVTDLNLMTRRGALRHGLRKIDLAEPVTLACDGMSVLLVATGGVHVARQTLGPLDAMVSTGPVRWTIVPAGLCRLWIAEFRAV